MARVGYALALVMDAKARKKAQKKAAKEERRQASGVGKAERSQMVVAGPAKWGQAAQIIVKRLNGLYESSDEEVAGNSIKEFDAVVGMNDRNGRPLPLEVLRGTVAGCISDPSKAKPTPIQVDT